MSSKFDSYPLKNNSWFQNSRGAVSLVMEEITVPHDVEGGVCYTLDGRWYRRSDGERMTNFNGRVMTVREAGQIARRIDENLVD